MPCACLPHPALLSLSLFLFLSRSLSGSRAASACRGKSCSRVCPRLWAVLAIGAAVVGAVLLLLCVCFCRQRCCCCCRRKPTRRPPPRTRLGSRLLSAESGFLAGGAIKTGVAHCCVRSPPHSTKFRVNTRRAHGRCCVTEQAGWVAVECVENCGSAASLCSTRTSCGTSCTRKTIATASLSCPSPGPLLLPLRSTFGSGCSMRRSYTHQLCSNALPFVPQVGRRARRGHPPRRHHAGAGVGAGRQGALLRDLPPDPRHGVASVTRDSNSTYQPSCFA